MRYRCHVGDFFEQEAEGNDPEVPEGNSCTCPSCAAVMEERETVPDTIATDMRQAWRSAPRQWPNHIVFECLRCGLWALVSKNTERYMSGIFHRVDDPCGFCIQQMGNAVARA